MSRFLLFIFVLCFSQSVLAQRHEIGIFAGGANVIGDVGKGNYINPFPTRTAKGGDIVLPISIGGIYRFNINPHMGFRLNLTYSNVGAGDFKSGEQFKIDRDAKFKNDILEGAILFEYNFRDINEAQEYAHSPYIFFGGGLFSAKAQKYDFNEEDNDIVVGTKRKSNVVLPFGVGYKFRLNYSWLLSFESGFRYTNQDFLDYNTGEFTQKLKDKGIQDSYIQDQIDKRVYGNLSNKDWYVQTGFTLTYSFGRPPCYCN